MGGFRAAMLDSESEDVLEDQFDSPEDGMDLESNFPIIASSSQPERIVSAKRPASTAQLPTVLQPIRGAGGAIQSAGKRGERAVVRDSKVISEEDDDSEVEVVEYNPVNARRDERRNEGVDSEEERELTLELDSEIKSVDTQIKQLQSLKSTLERKRFDIRAALRKTHAEPNAKRQKIAPVSSKGVVNFEKGDYEWSAKLKHVMTSVWGIEGFRFHQEGVINATMSGRDVVCIMPTGGGKSLTFQASALLSKGVTIVITPLISLMQDQCYNLQAVNVRAEAINGETPAAVATAMLKSIIAGTSAGGAKSKATTKGKGKGKEREDSVEFEEVTDTREIKLIYCTPEKLDKSKTLVSALQKIYAAGLLARIVIDEAHCCSTLGHDYRTSYTKLSILRKLFPKTALLALTATCPSKVLSDTLSILGLPAKTTPGDAAAPSGAVLFTSPLYRPNLRYSVIPKTANPIGAIIDFIEEKRNGQSGIIYCLSQSDTQTVASSIYKQSNGKIVTATYHAGLDDAEKVRVHNLWRAKKIHVVVATIAFGLGIDSPDVRFVIHHTLSKSIDGYYQESGRAGRDGKEADCVILFKGSDVGRLMGIMGREQGGNAKVFAMTDFAMDLRTCRKISFARYFSDSKFEDDEEAEAVCGHCDNCQRDGSSINTISISTHVYRTLRILHEAVNRQSATLTLKQATDLVRGLGGGNFATVRGETKGKGHVDVAEIAGGKVVLGNDDTESLILYLMMNEYLAEMLHFTEYTVIVYLKPTQKSLRFTRLSLQEFEANGSPVELKMDFPVIPKKKRVSAVGTASAKSGKKASTTTTAKAKVVKSQPQASSSSSKSGKKAAQIEEEMMENDEEEWENAHENDVDEFNFIDGAGEEEMNQRVDEDGWEVFPAKK